MPACWVSRHASGAFLSGRTDSPTKKNFWRDDRNRIRITLISDDNFFLFQKTQLVEFVVTGP